MPRNFMVSCYPEHWTHPVVGNGSADWNRAIECWSSVLVKAAKENAKAFNRDEWNLLAKSLGPINRGRDAECRLPTSYEQPGIFLAGLVNDTDTAMKLSELDYVHAWAVLKAIDWRLTLNVVIKPRDAWWTPEFWETATEALEVKQR